MKISAQILLLSAAVALGPGCDNAPGPDSLSSHGGGAGGVSVTNCVATCHLPGGSVGPDPLATNGSGTAGKHIAHVTSRGISCVKCHFNYDTNPNHFNGVINSKGIGSAPVYFDAANPAGLWTFVTPSGPGSCSSTVCHRTLAPDWYGTAVPPLDTVCSNCHDAAIGARRQVLGAAGDFGSNPSVTSHHVAGALDPTPAQCTVCHDQSLHMGGTVRLAHADTGTRIDFDPANPATLEPFCLSCHDGDSASGNTSPFADGQNLGTAPYVASREISTAWNGSSVHRARGLTCAGGGSPASLGCHGSDRSINMHGSAVKGILTSTMNFQIPLVTLAAYTADPLGSSYNYGNFQLCFDCHANYPAVTREVVLGYQSGGVYDTGRAPTPFFTAGIRSVFREHYDPLQTMVYNDTMWGDTYLALHNYHLLGFEVNVMVDPTQNMLQWKYRGDPAMNGRITCTACHAVHGTAAATVRSTYVELDLQTFTGIGADRYTSIATFISSSIMTSPPMNCAIDCHGVAGQTSYWHTPAGL